jgi:hypothetical protein
MRFAVRFSVCVGFATTSLLNSAQFSETRDLPPLKLAAKELDTILSKTHLFLDATQALESSFEGRVVGFYREPGGAGTGVYP